MSSNAPTFATVQFSTEGLASGERVALLRDASARSVLRRDFELLPYQRCHASLTMRVLPGLSMVLGVAGGMRLQRNRRSEAEGSDDVVLRIHAGGSATVSQLGKDVTLTQGGILLSIADSDAVAIPARTRYASLRLARKTLAPFVPRLDDAVMQPIPKDNEALQLLRSYISVIQDKCGLATPELQRLFVTHVYDLSALVIGASRDAAAVANDRGVAAARLRRIKGDIADNLQHDELSIAAVAGRQRVSARYVQMLFEKDGTTFSRFVLEQRLIRAHRLLSDLRCVDWTITTIAFAVGFDDLSYFNRTFRRRYGSSPSDVRKSARHERRQ